MKINTNNLKVDINLVQPNKYNPKLSVDDNEHNAIEFEKIKESLRVAGQIQPTIVREIEGGKYEIINGFHRYKAMKELESQEIEIKNLGKIDFDTAVAIALQTEDTKIPIDNIELAMLLNKLVDGKKGLDYWSELLPYDKEFIKSEIGLINFDFDSLYKGSKFTYTFKISDENKEEVKSFFNREDNENAKLLLDLINN